MDVGEDNSNNSNKHQGKSSNDISEEDGDLIHGLKERIKELEDLIGKNKADDPFYKESICTIKFKNIHPYVMS